MSATRDPSSESASESNALAAHTHGAPRPRTTVGDAALSRAAGLFRAAGEPSRLRLLELLLHGELCVTEVAELTREELSTVSQRLRVLRTEHLVSRRRDGKHIYYALADEHVADLIRAVLAHASEEPTHDRHHTHDTE